MAKELPYFRFTVQEWQNGKISLESFELQGIFISICGYYWIQDCSLTLTLLKKKYRGFEKLIDELIELSIFKFNKKTDEVEITFLNIQFDLLSKARQSKQKAGSIGGKQKSSNAKATLEQKPSYKDKEKDNNKDKEKDKDNILQNSIEILPQTNLADNILPLEEERQNTASLGVAKIHPLNNHIKQNYPTVWKLQNMTDEECDFIRTTYPKDLIIEKLESMENKKDLIKKYKSCYLTLNNWLKKGMKDKPKGKTEKIYDALQESLQMDTFSFSHIIKPSTNELHD